MMKGCRLRKPLTKSATAGNAVLYRVIVQKLARADLREAYDWAAKRAPQTAARWLDRFEQALQTLERQPQSRPLARESKGADVEVREFLFGKRPYVFRSLFTIDGDRVRILRIRRAQRRPLSQSDLRKAIESDE